MDTLSFRKSRRREERTVLGNKSASKVQMITSIWMSAQCLGSKTQTLLRLSGKSLAARIQNQVCLTLKHMPFPLFYCANLAEDTI